MIRASGETGWFRGSSKPRKQNDGSVLWTGLVLDITEHKQAEESLRESEDRYRELFDESPVAIWVEDWSPIKQMLHDLARGGVKDLRGYFNSHRDQLKTAYDLGEILEISYATVELYRKESKEHLMRMTDAAVVIDEELDAFLEMILSFLAGQMSADIEAKDTAGDGSEIIVRRRVIIPPKYHGDWSRVIFAIEDVSERKRVEAALRESEARLAKTARMARVGYWVWDEIEDKAVYCSNELAEINGVATGKELAAMLTSTEKDLSTIHPDDRDYVAKTARESVAEKRGYDIEYRLIRSDGEVRHLREILEPILDDEGSLVRSTGIIQDITDLK